MLRSLGFFEITGISVLNCNRIVRRVGLDLKSRGYNKCKWAHNGPFTLIANRQCEVYLRYSHDSIIEGDMFRKFIIDSGCKRDDSILSILPGRFEQFDTEQLLTAIFNPVVY